MPHDVSLIALLAVAFVLASALGYVASRLRLPPLVGYLVAGALMARSIPGFEADTAMASQLAEIGVILLMFSLGLGFTIRKIAKLASTAGLIAAVEIGLCISLGYLAVINGVDSTARMERGRVVKQVR